jgi:hypothetical protein
MEKQRKRKNLMDVYADYHKYGLNINKYSGLTFVTFDVSVPKKSEIIVNDKPLCGRRLVDRFRKDIIKNNILTSTEFGFDYTERDEVWDNDKKEESINEELIL